MANLKRYVVFYHYRNEDLKALLIKRAKELGYRNTYNCSFYDSVSLDTTEGTLRQTGYDENIEKSCPEDHELGNFRDFLITDQYRYGYHIRVGDYKVVFKDNGIQVGCTFVDKETILKIAEKFKD
jgi:hypothetical protein